VLYSRPSRASTAAGCAGDAPERAFGSLFDFMLQNTVNDMFSAKVYAKAHRRAAATPPQRPQRNAAGGNGRSGLATGAAGWQRAQRVATGAAGWQRPAGVATQVPASTLRVNCEYPASTLRVPREYPVRTLGTCWGCLYCSARARGRTSSSS
jgi:hypothetical protein